MKIQIFWSIVSFEKLPLSLQSGSEVDNFEMPNNNSRKRKRMDWSEKLRIVKVILEEFGGKVQELLRNEEWRNGRWRKNEVSGSGNWCSWGAHCEPSHLRSLRVNCFNVSSVIDCTYFLVSCIITIFCNPKHLLIFLL